MGARCFARRPKGCGTTNVLINYVAQPDRLTPLNLMVGRVLLAVYAVWKLLSYDFHVLVDWPWFLFQQHANGAMAHRILLDWIEIEVGLTLLCLIAFAFGAYVAVSALLAAAMILHMGALHYVVTNSGATWLPVALTLIVWAIYRETDRLTLDGWRQSGQSLKDFWRQTLDSRRQGHAHTILAWTLVFIAVGYFFTGYSKIVNVGWSWTYASNLARLVRWEQLLHMGEVTWAGQVMINYPWVSGVAGVLTVVLELALVVLVVCRLPITLVVLGLLGMHTGIALAMGVFFFDQYILFLLFAPWDRIFLQHSPVEAN